MRYREILEATNINASKAQAWNDLGKWLQKFAGDPMVYHYLDTKLYTYLRQRNVMNPSTKDQQWYYGVLNQCATDLGSRFPNVWQFETDSWVRFYMNGGSGDARAGKTYMTFADPVQGISSLSAFLNQMASSAPKAHMSFKLHKNFNDFYEDVDNLVIHYPNAAGSLLAPLVKQTAARVGMQLTDRSSVHRSEEGRDIDNNSDSELIVRNIIANMQAYPSWQTAIKTNPAAVETWLDTMIKQQMGNAAHREIDPWHRQAA